MTAAYTSEAYVFGSSENHNLLEAESNELLHFGHRFPAPSGGSTWLDEHGEPDPLTASKPGSHAVWHMSTRSVSSTANPMQKSS